MNWKLNLMTAVAIAALGLSLSACELNEECDPETDPECIPTGGDTGGDAGNGDTGPQFQTYNYILIEDLDPNAGGQRPGADIDGVTLSKGGQNFYLASIEEFGDGVADAASGANNNRNNMLGAPENQCVGLDDPDDWDLSTIYSMRGIGGYIVGRFDQTANIETGDQLTVHACLGELCAEAGEDCVIDVSVGVANSASADNWFQVIDGAEGTVSINIPSLPNVPRN